ncbi:hypothetical protein FRC03_005819 [Tulasnella sp. 419]|nr:hypothetical protein FRC03_005819 [Tulasnella sp. 419]
MDCGVHGIHQDRGAHENAQVSSSSRSSRKPGGADWLASRCSKFKSQPTQTYRCPSSEMPLDHIYDGVQHTTGRKPSKRHTVPINPVEQQRRQQAKDDDNYKFDTMMRNLFELIDAEVQNIHEETGRSISFIQTALGVAGPELKGKRSGSLYNAWVHVRMRDVNDDNEAEGRERISLADFKEKYGHEYALLTPAERESHCEALTEHRQLQHSTERKICNAAQTDVEATITQVQDILCRLEMRTGYLCFLIGHRGDENTQSKAMFYISDQLKLFLDCTFRINVSDFLAKSEIYALHGTRGVAQNTQEEKAVQKHTVVSRFNNSLYTAIGRSNVRMNYIHFKERIELDLGVELVGWPFGKVTNPSLMCKSDLQLLYNGLTATPPTIFFQKLTPEQHKMKKAAFKQGQHIKVLTPTTETPSLLLLQYENLFP